MGTNMKPRSTRQENTFVSISFGAVKGLAAIQVVRSCSLHVCSTAGVGLGSFRVVDQIYYNFSDILP